MSKILEDKNKERMLSFYDTLLDNYGVDDARSLGWYNDSTKNIRYQILCEVGDLNNHSVLDVGCGFGDLFDFIKKKNINFTYKGIDINSNMINKAIKKYQNAQFETIDFGVFNKDEKYDYVFCSGGLSFMVPDYKQFYFEYVEKMFECSKIAVVFNMLNRNNNNKPEDDEIFATYSTEEVLDFCLKLTDKVTIRENYLSNDFSVYLYH